MSIPAKIITATLLVVLFPIVILLAIELVNYVNNTVRLFDDFQGEYDASGPLVTHFFRLNADKTFYSFNQLDIGAATEVTGTVSVENNQFVVVPYQAEGVYLHQRFLPVRWGARRYLLDDDNFLKSLFCEEVKRGEEPRTSVGGIVYLRTSEMSVPVAGFPVYLNGQRVCP